MIPPGDGVEVLITLTYDIYTPAAIRETIHAFQELCDVEVDVQGDCSNLRIHIKPDCPSAACDDFLNYALDLSAQELLSGKE
jgi:hypothetical protein